MNEEDIQRKIDGQLAHLRNEFNEKLQDAHLRIAELENLRWLDDKLAEVEEKKKKPKQIVRYYFRVPNEKNAFKRIFSLAYQLTESKCVEAPIEEGEPLYAFIRDFLECFSGNEIDFLNDKKITWLKEDNLAIYLIDKLRENKWIDDHNLDIKIENIFGIKNPAQKRSNYFSNNKERRPKNHYLIDDIIAKVNKLENYDWTGEVID